jgi:hypothetical protein
VSFCFIDFWAISTIFQLFFTGASPPGHFPWYFDPESSQFSACFTEFPGASLENTICLFRGKDSKPPFFLYPCHTMRSGPAPGICPKTIVGHLGSIQNEGRLSCCAMPHAIRMTCMHAVAWCAKPNPAVAPGGYAGYCTDLYPSIQSCISPSVQNRQFTFHDLNSPGVSSPETYQVCKNIRIRIYKHTTILSLGEVQILHCSTDAIAPALSTHNKRGLKLFRHHSATFTRSRREVGGVQLVDERRPACTVAHRHRV